MNTIEQTGAAQVSRGTHQRSVWRSCVRTIAIGATLGAVPMAALGYLSVLGFWNASGPPMLGDYLRTMILLGSVGGIAGGGVGAAGWWVYRRLTRHR
jgi:hypothetical protein